MSVYLPSGAVGNGRILATLGQKGELMSLFWPSIDFANNVHEAMPAVYLGEHRQGTFYWTWYEAFEARQYYLGNTNILVTQLRLPEAGLEIIITDFCPPSDICEACEHAFVRRVRVENRSPIPLRGLFMHYFDLRLGEIPWKQAVRYDSDTKCLVQYLRDIAVAVGGTPPDLWRCGKWSREDTSAKNDMYDGYLEGQPEDIGEVNFALAWRIDLQRDRAKDISIIVAFDTSREGAAQRLFALCEIGTDELQRRTHLENAAWLERARPVNLPSWLTAAYRRALLAIRVLADHHTGAIIAAPEFDPTYELCGGYGYCWPRDAAEAALALAEAGYPDYLIRLAQWLARVQLSSALWGQRYWTSGSVAASWSLRHDFLQLDQTASALIVICRALELLNDATPNHCLATAAAPEQDVLWRVTRSGANALLQSLGDDYCHKTACDLWETYPGVFAYTQAAIVAALGAARDCAVRHQDNDFAAELEHARVLAHQALMTFYVNGYFARGRIHGRLDPTVDSSTLGLVEPWRVLDLLHPVHRQMAVSTLSKIEDRLQYDLPEGRGIKRYEGDAYMSGAVGAVNTLWTALVCYRLALSAEHDGDARSWRDKADQYVRVALAHTTPTGLLPELIPLTPQYPYWAAPHAWASALLVRCALAAHQLGTRTLGRQDTVEASMPEALPPPTSQT